MESWGGFQCFIAVFVGKAADHREQFIKPATVCSAYVGISREKETEGTSEREEERRNVCLYVGGGEKKRTRRETPRTDAH